MVLSILIRMSCGLLLAGTLGPTAFAQVYPDKPIQMYVGFPAGGGADIIARFYTSRLSTVLKQQVLVQNRTGANGNIAAEAVARAKPDGYTLLFGPSALMAGGKFLYKHMPVNPITDYTMIAPLNELGFTAVVRKDSPINSVQELKAYVQQKSNATYGTSNSMSQASALLFLYQGKLNATAVPYKATADAIRDMNSGDIDFMYSDGPFAVAQAAAGQLKMLAVTTTYRAPGAENVPTMRESGFPDYEITGWFMAVAPAKTPDAIVTTLNDAFTIIAKTDDAKQFFGKLGSIPLLDTPAGASRKLVEDTERWRLIAEAGNIQPQ